MTLDDSLRKRLVSSENNYSGLLELCNRQQEAADHKRLVLMVRVSAAGLGALSVAGLGISAYLGSWRLASASCLAALVAVINFSSSNSDESRKECGIGSHEICQAELRLMNTLTAASKDTNYIQKRLQEEAPEYLPPRTSYVFTEKHAHLIFKVYYLFFSIRAKEAYIVYTEANEDKKNEKKQEAAEYKCFAAAFFMFSCQPRHYTGRLARLYQGETLLCVEKGPIQALSFLDRYIPQVKLSSEDILEHSLFQIARLMRPPRPPQPPKITHTSRGVQTEPLSEPVIQTIPPVQPPSKPVPRLLGARIISDYLPPQK